ncbi:response regulator transcription factor [Roseateles sp.]|uniref:response regulator transcription factor n=1 Tax=Roseateles sp. TaxID=1971397 RepID=UPI0025D037DF|nr:response regulator transcription factor [Roseateles sp.]MBV8036186.1 response regulator transcription factor [Roseateles sp.]
MRLLLLEDDDTLGEALSAFLRLDGHVVEWFRQLRDAQAVVDEPFDALLVDWQLPDGSGVDWVRRLRERRRTLPILVLTARDLLPDRIEGLDSGADDYLVKPFPPEELVARLRAVRRRQLSQGIPRLALPDGVSVDLPGRSVWRGEDPVELTAREWALLEALASRAGRVVSRTDLESLSQGFDGDAASNVLEVHVSNLRRKLGRGVIETVRGLGYRVPR